MCQRNTISSVALFYCLCLGFFRENFKKVEFVSVSYPVFFESLFAALLFLFASDFGIVPIFIVRQARWPPVGVQVKAFMSAFLVTFPGFGDLFLWLV